MARQRWMKKIDQRHDSVGPATPIRPEWRPVELLKTLQRPMISRDDFGRAQSLPLQPRVPRYGCKRFVHGQRRHRQRIETEGRGGHALDPGLERYTACLGKTRGWTPQ